MQTKRLTQKIIEERKDILEKSYKYMLTRRRNHGFPSKERYTNVIAIISKMYEDHWSIMQLVLQYQKHYGMTIPYETMAKIVKDLENGGGLMRLSMVNRSGNECLYSVCDKNVSVQCIDVYTRKHLTSVPVNDKLNQCVYEILKEYKLDMTGASLTILVKKI
jgi:sulfur relay (sulfurtransferase) DsrC/TusE family protein